MPSCEPGTYFAIDRFHSSYYDVLLHHARPLADAGLLIADIFLQELLLRYVYDTRICHPLLQPKSDEDIWNETWSYSTSPHSVPDVRDGMFLFLL